MYNTFRIGEEEVLISPGECQKVDHLHIISIKMETSVKTFNLNIAYDAKLQKNKTRYYASNSQGFMPVCFLNAVLKCDILL